MKAMMKGLVPAAAHIARHRIDHGRADVQRVEAAEDGTIRVWADGEAEDSDEALARYREPFYALNQRFALGSNALHVLGGA